MFRLMPVAVTLLLAPAVGGPTAFYAKASDAAGAAVIPAQPAPDRGVTVIDQSRDGLFYLDAEVNGTTVHFVVDSGASVVILNAADAARAGVVARGGVSVDTAGGAASMRRARLQRLALAGQDLADVDAVVQRDLAVSLLGQSALSQMRSITFHGNQLELR